MGSIERAVSTQSPVYSGPHSGLLTGGCREAEPHDSMIRRVPYQVSDDSMVNREDAF